MANTLGFSDLINNNILFKKLLPRIPNFLEQLHITIPTGLLFTIFIYLVVISLVVFAIYCLYCFFLIRLQLKQQFTILEVKPLQETLQSSYTTQQLFGLIHGLAKQRSFWDRLIGNSKSYSFEIVSTKEEGIRYLIRINQEDSELVKKGLLSYLPGLAVNEAKDYLENLSNDKSKVVEFTLANHFAFPLKKQEQLMEHDPIAYITGNMTKLATDELVALQIVVSPLNKSKVGDIKEISKLIYTNSDLVTNLKHLGAAKLPIVVFKFVLFAVLHLITLPIGLFVFLMSEGREGPFLKLNFGYSKKKTDNAYQAELETMIKGKLDQPLFSTSLRLLVVGIPTETHKRVRGFMSSLSSFSNSTYQSLIPAFNIRLKFWQKMKLYTFNNRLLSFLGNSILSVSEVSDIYHFPFTNTTKTENLVKVHSKELPAPISLKKVSNLDIVFAKNTYGGSTTDIGLSAEERRRHMYILGATGTGKSTLLLSMINQDITNGKGLCVIDPHGDLIEKILPLIPESRLKDVIYFNPDDISYPIGINLLERSGDLNEEDTLKEKEFITESIISLFHKIYDDKYSGPRMEYILRNTIHTAFTIPNPILFTIYKLLINTPYRKGIVNNLDDENLKDFWKYEFSKAGDYQKVKMISPITNKIGRFLFSPTAKRILEQEKSTINFDDIMDKGKILLCNLSKGRIGEDNSEIFGVVIMTKIQLAALKRARVDITNRRDFYLYVDEFQNFATPAFAQILSEARKYRLNAILAHQTTSQLEDKSLVNVTLANTGTIICFRTANPEDEKLILPQFQPYVEQGEIANLPSFHFYIKIAALNPEEPFSGETILVDVPADKERIKQVIESSRKLFAHKYAPQKPSSLQTTKSVTNAKVKSKVTRPEENKTYQLKLKSVSAR